MNQNEEPLVRPVHTSCGDCVFSKKDKQTQIGCDFDKIELYRERGADVVEAYDKFNNEFFVINDRVCLHKRTKLWAEDYPKKKWKSMVQEQVRLKYHAMVVFKEGDLVEDLESTLMSLNNQDIPPAVLTIINRSKMAASELVENVHDMNCDNLDWRLQTFFEDDLHDRNAIDIVIDSSKNYTTSIFYIVFYVPFQVPSQCSREIQKYFVDDLKHAVFARPREDGNGMLVNSSFHIKHGGNAFNVRIEDKLMEFEDEEIKKYIINIEEICPSLKM